MNRIIIAFAAAMICAATAHAQGSIVIGEQFPTQGQATQVRITDDDGSPVAGAAVTVTYRPGSSVSRTDSLGVSQSGGVIKWTPADPGIATVTATWADAAGEELTSNSNVSIRFASPPIDGIIIMIVAGLLLVVGSIIRVARVMNEPDPS